MSYLGNADYQRLYLESAKSAGTEYGTYAGLVTVDDEQSVSVNVATMYGQVKVSVELQAKAPVVDSAWDDIAEISLLKTAGDAVTLVNGSGDEIEEPETLIGEDMRGTFRVRIHRSGQGFDEGEEPTSYEDPRTERLLLIAWPSTQVSEPMAIQMNSESAQETQKWSQTHESDEGWHAENDMDPDELAQIERNLRQVE